MSDNMTNLYHLVLDNDLVDKSMQICFVGGGIKRFHTGCVGKQTRHRGSYDASGGGKRSRTVEY